MKLLAFSDLHRDTKAARAILDAAKGADVLVGAGDFATQGEGAADTINILMSCDRPVVFVHGNHDRPNELHELCSDWTHGHYLHGTGVVLNGVEFFGLGGEVPSRGDAHWNMTETEETALSMFQECPHRCVLVTHTPPFGVADLQKDGSHEGSKAVLQTIRDKQPILNFCGHIHSAWGMHGILGETMVHNLGPNLNWFDIF